MRLVDAHVTHYRSVEDSEKFNVDPKVTCLVGKNEAGKTALLQALYRLNPVESTPHFDEDLDFPARQSRQRQKYKRDQLVPVITGCFELTDDEVARVAAELGQNALTSRNLTNVHPRQGIPVPGRAMDVRLRRERDRRAPDRPARPDLPRRCRHAGHGRRPG